MPVVVTLTDVQHWNMLRQVTICSDTVFTSQAQQWLAEHHIEVLRDDADAPPISDDAGTLEPAMDSFLEVQLLGWVPRVLAELGVNLPSVDVRETVRKLFQLDTNISHADQLGIMADKPARQPLQRAIITVLGKDRVGIISCITSILSARQTNVLDINQTIFGDLFSMNMSVDISSTSVSFAELRDVLEKAGDEMQLKVLVQREAVFDYMHRV